MLFWRKVGVAGIDDAKLRAILFQMINPYHIRPATLADADAVDALLGRSYPILLAPDYPADMLTAALPGMTRAKPELLTSGTYFVALNGQGQIIAAGGWTIADPTDPSADHATGHIRHVATDPGCRRMGLGRALMAKVMADSTQAGIRQMACLSTRTAVPFYRAMGFVTLGAQDVTLRSGAVFPAVAMWADLQA